MYVLVGGRFLNKLLRPLGLVDIVGRWKNCPTCADIAVCVYGVIIHKYKVLK
jgi:hypothetical protein